MVSETRDVSGDRAQSNLAEATAMAEAKAAFTVGRWGHRSDGEELSAVIQKLGLGGCDCVGVEGDRGLR
jgi:hypothetical protein